MKKILITATVLIILTLLIWSYLQFRKKVGTWKNIWIRKGAGGTEYAVEFTAGSRPKAGSVQIGDTVVLKNTGKFSGKHTAQEVVEISGEVKLIYLTSVIALQEGAELFPEGIVSISKQ